MSIAHYRHRLSALLIAVTTLLMAFAANGEQQKTFGPYQVHYSVLNTTFITPDVAKNYGITRGKNRALVNIAVRKSQADGSSTAKKAIITGSSSDLIHTTELAFKEINEQDAIYYLAELRFNHQEMRVFTIKVQPDPNIAPYTLKFQKTLYVNE